jgi:ATP-dependent helicase IRC3
MRHVLIILQPHLLQIGVVRCSSTAAFILRPYQESCLAACFDALDAGVRRIGVSLPTGAGKTAVFVSLLSRLETRDDASTKGALVIVNSIELARQTAALAQRMRPDWQVDIEQGAKYHASGTADLCVLHHRRPMLFTGVSALGPSRRTRRFCARKG